MKQATARIAVPTSFTERPDHLKSFLVPAGIALALSGCATQDQLRQTEAQQGQAVQALRADANRSESGISELRAEVRRTQDSLHGLEVALAEARTRTDAAKAQADSALATSRDFLGNLIAARDEQRRQLEQNGVAFAELRRKAADLETRLQAQQRLMDQSATAFADAILRLAGGRGRVAGGRAPGPERWRRGRKPVRNPAKP